MYVNRANSGCDYHRVGLPLKYLPNVRRASSYRTANVIFFNRLPLEPIDIFLASKKKFGFKHIVDVDDYWYLYPEHKLYDEWMRLKVPQQIEIAIKSADAVTCTNEQLAAKIRPLNDNVHIIPNALPFSQEQFTGQNTPTDKLRIIYAGGSSHYHDLKLVSDVIVQFCKDNPRDVEFRLAGFDSSINEWHKIKALFDPIGGKQFFIAPNQSIETYMNVYNGANLAIAPLVDNEFNRCKSNLKTIEAGCKIMPIITSHIPPYTNELDFFNVTTAESTSGWTHHLNYALNRKHYLKEWGQDLRSHANMFYNLHHANKLREDLFNSMIY